MRLIESMNFGKAIKIGVLISPSSMADGLDMQCPRWVGIFTESASCASVAQDIPIVIL